MYNPFSASLLELYSTSEYLLPILDLPVSDVCVVLMLRGLSTLLRRYMCFIVVIYLNL